MTHDMNKLLWIFDYENEAFNEETEAGNGVKYDLSHNSMKWSWTTSVY